MTNKRKTNFIFWNRHFKQETGLDCRQASQTRVYGQVLLTEVVLMCGMIILLIHICMLF